MSKKNSFLKKRNNMEKKKTYSELLRSPLWQKKRLEIMQRDDFACQHCGSEDNELQVHHLVYHKGAKPWEYDNSELITLCSHCHEMETEAKSQHYETFKEICKLGREVGLSEQFIDTLFCRVLSAIALLTNNEDYGIYGGEEDLLKNTLYGTQVLNDAKVLFSNGIKLSKEEENNLLMYCPNLYDIYKKTHHE